MDYFFIIAPPGLEEIVESELRDWLPALGLPSAHPMIREKGGLTIELPGGAGLALNKVLKTPSRILMRITEFRCRDFPKLFRKVRGLPWSDFCEPRKSTVRFQVSSHASRLAVKKKIEKTCEDGFGAWEKSLNDESEGAGDGEAKVSTRPTAEQVELTVFVRFQDDVCTISVDTSGVHLHKRGYRVETPEAPLRENFAATLLLAQLASGFRESTASEGEKAPWTLVDPMAGSGTFLLEAALLRRSVPRRFAYEDFPCVRGGRCKPPELQGAPEGLPEFASLIGWEVDAETLRVAQGNIARIALGDKVKFVLHDAFAASMLPQPQECGETAAAAGIDWRTDTSRGERTAVICNPPYGERLKISGPLTDYYSKLFASVEEQLRPDCAGFLLPAKAPLARIRRPRKWRLRREWRFSNGGIAVVFYVFDRASSAKKS